MVDLPRGSYFNIWEFATNVDLGESFIKVQCVIMDGVNKVGSFFLGSQFARILGLSSTITFTLGSLVYLTQPMIYVGEVQGLLPSFLGNLQNLQIFSYDQNQILNNILDNFAILRNLQIL
jgi:hypothetical protein